MKTILMKELKPGDIFTHEVKLYNRTAFKVIDVSKRLTCINRTTNETIKKTIEGHVVLLRHED